MFASPPGMDESRFCPRTGQGGLYAWPRVGFGGFWISLEARY